MCDPVETDDSAYPENYPEVSFDVAEFLLVYLIALLLLAHPPQSGGLPQLVEGLGGLEAVILALLQVL
jgi:hypothetical protein